MVETKEINLSHNRRDRYETIASAIKKMIREGGKNTTVASFTRRVLNASGVREKNHNAEIDALFKFVRDKIPYRRDNQEVDTFVGAEYQIQEYLKNPKTGGASGSDCDCKTILLGSMLKSIGYKVRAVLMANGPKNYTHIYLQVFHGGQWVDLETTERWEMGRRAPATIRGIIAPQGI